MAKLNNPTLTFDYGMPDCGRRTMELPPPLPRVGDDFNWDTRTFDEFRRVMLEELSARFPDRQQWNPADLEVVLLEVLAAALDQISDMNDRITAEHYLETARKPETVYRLLTLIGYDPGREISGATADPAQVIQAWQTEPWRMEAARKKGPDSIRTQERMVTLADYQEQIAEHPLVCQASAWSQWGGSWPVVRIGLSLVNHHRLDDAVEGPLFFPAPICRAVDQFHAIQGLPAVDWETAPSIRTILRTFLDHRRMTGQEVTMEDAVPVGIALALAVSVRPNYYKTEIHQALSQALGREGFFRPGKLPFGEDLYCGDIYHA
ncbi:MAG: hypothetical protein MI756_00990, partial [Chromatiales bacterium]|nr:hypothetical protein [Chromatiales bacterium]